MSAKDMDNSQVINTYILINIEHKQDQPGYAQYILLTMNIDYHTKAPTELENTEYYTLPTGLWSSHTMCPALRVSCVSST